MLTANFLPRSKCDQPLSLSKFMREQAIQTLWWCIRRAHMKYSQEGGVVTGQRCAIHIDGYRLQATGFRDVMVVVVMQRRWHRGRYRSSAMRHGDVGRESGRYCFTDGGGGSEEVRGGGRGGGQRMPLPRPPPPPLPTALPTDRINKRTQRKRGRKERTTKHREGVCVFACVHIERDRDCEMNRREKKQTTTREGERDTQADDTSGHETRRGLQQTKQRLQQQR